MKKNNILLTILLTLILIALVVLIVLNVINLKNKKDNTQPETKIEEKVNNDDEKEEKVDEQALFDKYYNESLNLIEAYEIGSNLAGYLNSINPSFTYEYNNETNQYETNITKEDFKNYFKDLLTENLIKALLENNKYHVSTGEDDPKYITFKNNKLVIADQPRGSSILYAGYSRMEVTESTQDKITYKVYHNFCSASPAINGKCEGGEEIEEKSFNFVLVKEDNEWKVDNIDVVY